MNRAATTAAAFAALAAASPAALVETNLPTPLVEYSIMMDRMQKNELERARAEMQVERLQGEMRRLQAEKASLEAKRGELQRDVTNLQARADAQAQAAPSFRPGCLLVALVETRLARPGAPPRAVAPLTVAVYVKPAGKAQRIEVALGDGSYEADAADFASEEDLLARLQRRVQFAEQQLRMVPDDPDPAETDRIARYEAQIDRAKNTLTEVRRALHTYRATPPPAPAPAAAP
jgi:molecular chaperone GrpE (heat shock protein)